MSYILDALNKSEKERERKRTPGLAALRESAAPAKFRLKHFVVLLGLLVVINMAGIYIYLGEPLFPTTTDTQVPAVVPGSVAPSGPVVDAVQPAVAPAAARPAPAIAPESVLTTLPVNVVDISALPRHIRENLPVIEITAHIYGSDPDLRMVRINGVSQHEGDLISERLQLVEITESGVVLNFEGYAYRMNVVDDWQIIE